MTKEERKLRKFIRGCWDGSMIKISEKGKPDAYQNTDEATIGLILAMRRAVIAGEREMFNIMRRAVIAQERERCAMYIETYGRGKCISEASSEALADEIRRQP